jgi:prepilin-type processing-associated H-X9-DG protein
MTAKYVESVQTLRGDFATAVQIVGVLKCPGEDLQNQIAHPDTPWVGAIQQIGRFRNVITGPVYVSLGAEPGYACPGYNANPANRVFTHYGVSANDAVDSWQYPTPIISSMKLDPSSPWPANTEFAPRAIARVPAKTWLAYDGTTGLEASGVVFRHPNLSANFAYFDGHAETLRVNDVDGAVWGPPPPYIVLDSRGLAVR